MDKALTDADSPLVAGRYRLLQPLGSGGFGDTFLARDEQLPSGRQVVVKRLRPIQDDEPTRQSVETAFHREASVLEEVGRDYPQIPALFAYFQEAGAFWLVQEYIPGPTLQSLGRIDSLQAHHLLQGLLPVLEHLHGRSLLHRDIKPDNIILRESDGQPVLIDFGAVREAMTVVQQPSGSIRSTVIIGTQGFMAPEQAVGQPIFSSDLYALARTLIAMLTGQNPLDLPTDPVTGQLQWREAAPEVDPALAAILDRASQTAPTLRYRTAGAMKMAVQQVAGQAPVPPTATVVVAPVSQPSPVPPPAGGSTVVVAPQAPLEIATRAGEIAEFQPARPSLLRRLLRRTGSAIRTLRVTWSGLSTTPAQITELPASPQVPAEPEAPRLAAPAIAAGPLTLTDPVILIRLTKTYCPGMTAQELYEATRGKWALRLKRAQKARYAYALHQGTVLQVYRIDHWSETDELSGHGAPRLRFTGTVAEDKQQHVGCSLAHYFRWGNASPVRYLNC